MFPPLRCLSKQVFLLYSSSRRCGKMRILRFIRWALFPSPREVASETRRVASYWRRGLRDTRDIFAAPFEPPSLALRIRALPVAAEEMPCDFCEQEIIPGEQYLPSRDGRVICCVPCSLGR
jgi:hypothetical protein